MSSITPTARDERVEDVEEGLDSPLPSSGPNETEADADGRGVAVLENANLPSRASSTIADVEAVAPDGSSPMVSAASRPGLDIVYDSDGPPLPFVMMASMLETTKGTGEHNRANARRPAGIEEVDNDGAPLLPAAMDSSLFDIRDDSASNKVSTNDQELGAGNTGLQSINDIGEPTELMPPAPFNPFMFEDHADDRKYLAPPSVDNEISREVQQHDSAVVDDEEAPQEAPRVVEEDDINSTGTIDFGVPGDVEEQTNPANVNDDSDENGIPFRRESSIPGITEAYPVDDNIIIAVRAEPTLPWRKQRRTKLLLVFVFVVVAVSAIGLGVSLSSSSTNSVTEVIVALALSSPPSTSAIPTFEPTTGHPSMTPTNSPSSSQLPSSLPSSCSYTISTNMQKLDFLHPDSSGHKTAIDGRNLVVVSTVVPESRYAFGSLYVIFYSLSDSNEWERAGDFIEGGIDLDFGCNVALSGKTTIVGLPSENPDTQQTVYVYIQNSVGLWEKISVGSPQPLNPFSWCGFGLSVDVDDNLMVTSDNSWCGFCISPSAAYLFKRTGGEWVEIVSLQDETLAITSKGNLGNWERWEELESLSNETIKITSEGEIVVDEVSIAGDTIAVKMSASEEELGSIPSPFTRACVIYLYKYDQEIDGVVSLTDILPGERCGPMILADDHLVHSADNGVLVYRRQGTNQPFELLQYFNSSDYGEGFGSALAMDKGILVVKRYNHAHIFSQQSNGIWEEVLTLDQYSYHYQISGRTLIATNHKGVYAMNIADCTQPIPTQMPSVSLAPTTCYLVEFEYSSLYLGDDKSPWGDLEATIQRIESDVVVVKTWRRVYEDEDTLCLNQGRYRFTLRVDIGNSNWPPEVPLPRYSVKSNGWVIAQGYIDVERWAEFSETTVFDIPFDPTTATAPTGQPLLVRPTYPPTPPSPSFSPPSPITSFPTPFPTYLQPSARPSTSTTIEPSDQEPASSITLTKACLKQSECEEQSQTMGFGSFYAGSYADYGCFSKGGNLYWGIGGSDAQKAISPLGGVKERVWCD